MSIDVGDVQLRKSFLKLESVDVSLLEQFNKRIKEKDKSYNVYFNLPSLILNQKQSFFQKIRHPRTPYISTKKYFNKLTPWSYDWMYVLNKIKFTYMYQQIGIVLKRFLDAYNIFISEILPIMNSLRMFLRVKKNDVNFSEIGIM